MTVHVHLLPTMFEPSELRDGVAVMIDILRASTTVAAALEAGATAVRPHAAVADARLAATAEPGLLGGERGGVRIDGFDLGNSPGDYTAGAVSGRLLHFTTTNGTQALARMSAADEVLIGSFACRAALTRRLRDVTADVHLVCAGTDGRLTTEDIQFAGAVAGDLIKEPSADQPLGTQLAVRLWRGTDDLLASVRGGQGGRNLIALGMGEDIARCLTEDTVTFVPRMRGDRIVRE